MKKENYNNFTKNNKNLNEPHVTDPSQAPTYSYYSRVLHKPFDTVNELKKAEEVYYAELKAKEDKTAQKKADAVKVEDAFKTLNAAKKTFKRDLDTVTRTYSENLAALKAAFEKDKAAVYTALAQAEESYSNALKAFTDKYPEGFHLTLKDGDFETTISSAHSSQAKNTKSSYTIDHIFDLLFNI